MLNPYELLVEWKRPRCPQCGCNTDFYGCFCNQKRKEPMIVVLADSEAEAKHLVDKFQAHLPVEPKWIWCYISESIVGQTDIIVLEAEGWKTRARSRSDLSRAHEVAAALRQHSFKGHIKLWLVEFNHRNYFG